MKLLMTATRISELARDSAGAAILLLGQIMNAFL